MKAASSKKTQIKKVLVLGSGALKIGEAGEFDYSGSQAIKALKQEKVKVVLINPNIATNQTSKNLADKIYFLPVNPYFVEKVIKKEKPDGVLLAFGGQTALNCGVELYEKGVFKKNKVKVLGTPISTISKTEDRQLFNDEMKSINIKVPTSRACNTIDSAIKAAEVVGYPVIIRAAFALGGKGSGFASNKKELLPLLKNAFAFSPQVLVEENLKGWKEVEYEIVRDAYDNCVTVCNMENFDPLGIHTGESIVIAPSQTLTNSEYHKLRDIGLKAIRHLGIIGECNIQYALDPESEDYRVIEVNARLSRSSALASKATGYPLAFIAAKLAMNHKLTDLKNAVSKKTVACFEPALDYVALKIPRWDLDKFQRVSTEITSEMKSVGEIMALGRSFEEVIQKGLRMLQIGLYGLTANAKIEFKTKSLTKEITRATPKRILAVAEALRKGWTTKKISKLSGIDLWFLEKLKNIIELERVLKKSKKLSLELIEKAKKYGYSDKQIALLTKKTEIQIRDLRKKYKLLPVIKQIDTLAAEYPATTNYLYATYHGKFNDEIYTVGKKKKKKKVIVLGSGPYCIGSSVEFDWCCVTAIKTLEKEGYETIMINYNPETVSTDYDICDKLYFEELSFERVLDIYEREKPEGIIISTGGQIPNNLSIKLRDAGVKVLGTHPNNIDRAEDRHKFSGMLDKLGIDQPKWTEISKLSQALQFAKKVKYPVLVRPSYVLSGSAMRVAHNADYLKEFLHNATLVSPDAPVVISKFEKGAKEIEIDAVAHKGRMVIYAIAEHVEHAGVHSGDATIVLPPQKLYIETIRKIKGIAKKIAKELHISGPFNIQFLAKANEVKVIECNLRASRSFPFASKVTNYDFIEIATHAMLNNGKSELLHTRYNTIDLDHVGVKAPQFSFSRLKGADPVLGVEMASTGEVACFGDNLKEAFLKAMISVGFVMPKKNIVLTVGRLEDKVELIDSAKLFLKMGFKLFATEGTSDFLNKEGIKNEKLYKLSSKKHPNIIDYIEQQKADLVIDIPKNYTRQEITDGYLIRRKAIDMNVPLITNVQITKLLAETLNELKMKDLEIKAWGEY